MFKTFKTRQEAKNFAKKFAEEYFCEHGPEIKRDGAKWTVEAESEMFEMGGYKEYFAHYEMLEQTERDRQAAVDAANDEAEKKYEIKNAIDDSYEGMHEEMTNPGDWDDHGIPDDEDGYIQGADGNVYGEDGHQYGANDEYEND